MRIVLFIALLSLATVAYARDSAQVRAFRKSNPCPSTGKTTGACPGMVVDHIVPLCWGGADAPANMGWQEVRQSYLKDRFEREACAMKKKLANPRGSDYELNYECHGCKWEYR